MSVEDLLTRRGRRFSAAMSVQYPDNPIHVVRGAGAYLYDADGREYLDCVNNVAHVGHAHPRVAEAAYRQLQVLNTNSRYLYEQLVDYADQLTGLLPDSLSMCFLVNSGSEANELALRLARTHTGHRGVAVLDGAYHGNTTSLIDMSPYKFDGPGGEGRQPHVQVAATPDPYAGRWRGADSAGAYAADLESALRRGTDDGYPAAAFFAEPLLGCAGQVEPPPGYLSAAFDAARSAGAVCVADEVQVGFGRVGEDFWAFEAQRTVPDIVTLGKPIGNGFPLGAVITTQQIAESFANGMEYFNTFGGNAASCVVGSTVADIIAEEGLASHAREVEQRLRSGFAELMSRHTVIGDVRGRGLFLGVALVEDRDTREPATTVARALVRRLRDDDRILLSLEGPGDNVVKIKPPLPFSLSDADRLLESVDRALGTSDSRDPGTPA